MGLLGANVGLAYLKYEPSYSIFCA